jgi:hypothetical protein
MEYWSAGSKKLEEIARKIREILSIIPKYERHFKREVQGTLTPPPPHPHFVFVALKFVLDYA